VVWGVMDVCGVGLTSGVDTLVNSAVLLEASVFCNMSVMRSC
jgi:hypothetical protein